MTIILVFSFLFLVFGSIRVIREIRVRLRKSV